MALPTITVLDGAGTSRAVAQRNSGRQAQGDSSAVVLSTEDLAALAAIVTAISNLASSLEIVDLGATSLAALENITVGGTVALDGPTLAALENITVSDAGLAGVNTRLDTLHADLIVAPDGNTVLGKVKLVSAAGADNSASAPVFTQAVTPTVLFAPISVAAGGSNLLVAATASKSIRVIGFALVSSAANTATFQSATTALTGPMAFAANGGVSAPQSTAGLFQTASGAALNLTLSAAAQVSGWLVYQLV